MRGLRLKFMISLYNHSSKIYAGIFKAGKSAWGIRKEEFFDFPAGSLGEKLGLFYQEKGFDVMPKLENHDVFHLVTQTNTEIQDEIAMQYLLFGNGKLSLYLIGMLLIGTFVFPEYYRYYRDSYRKGQAMRRFFDLEFKELLGVNFQELQQSLYYTNIHITTH